MEFKPKQEVYRSYNREVLHGSGGAGKSTGAGTISRKPLVIDFDNRWPSELVEKADFPRFDGTFAGVVALLKDILATEKLSNDRIVIDTVTKLLSRIEEHALAFDCGGNKEKYNAYSFGVKFLRQHFQEVLELVDRIQAKHKITVTFICHTKNKDQRNIDSEVYQKSCLDLPEGISELLKQWADYIGFIWFDVTVDASRKKAIGDAVRAISFSESPSYEAKNSSKYSIPTKIRYDRKGEWAEVVFGQTQALLKELDTLIGKLPVVKQSVIVERINKEGVRSFGVARLEEFIQAGKKAIGV